MAKNLFEQFLSFAASALAGPITPENIYREDAPSGLSGVAKYLAQQEAAAKAKEAAAMPAGTSSVERYLAKKNAALAALAAQDTGSSTAPEAASEPLTGVAKYLAGQGKSTKPASTSPVSAAPTPSTRVAKYLAGQIETAKPQAPAPVPKTGVGKYLAGSYKFETAKSAESSSKKPDKPAVKAAPAKPAPKSVASQPEPLAEKPKAAGTTIHLDDGKQCQASTSKGGQCKHTTNLGHVQRTINKQKYQFTVCTQHHNDSFKPYAPLLEAAQ